MSEPENRDASTSAERARVLELITRHGAHATSFQVLESGYKYWFDDALDACVAYVQSGRWRVAAGPPIAPPEHLAEATSAFIAASRVKRHRALFFSVDKAFLEALDEAGVRHDAVPIGSQPEWDPQEYHTRGPDRRSLRSQVRRAGRKGVSVRRVPQEVLEDPEDPVRQGIEEVVEAWLASRKMSVMRFMVDVELFKDTEARRVYVAECEEEVVGVLGAIPVYRRKGWFFEDVLRVSDAPNGTSELLIHSAMNDVAEDGSEYVTLGLSPLSDIRRGPGKHRLLRATLRGFYSRSDLLYPFEGIHRFKQRFRPDHWAPQYLVAAPPSVGPRALYRVLKVFAGGRMIDFGLRTLGRVLGRVPRRFWANATAVMATLLIPWTLFLGWIDEKWLGDDSMRWSWIVFDTIMIAALFWLARMIRRDEPRAASLSAALAGAVFTDLILTTVQGLYLHHDGGALAILVVLCGISGPAIALLLLTAIAIARTD